MKELNGYIYGSLEKQSKNTDSDLDAYIKYLDDSSKNELVDIYRKYEKPQTHSLTQNGEGGIIIRP